MKKHRLFIKFITRSFVNDKRRSANIIFSISLSVTFFLLLLFTTTSFQKSWSNFYNKSAVDIVVSEKNRVEPFTSSIDTGVQNALEAIPGVAKISGVLLDIGSYRNTTFVVFGYAHSSMYYESMIVEGKIPAKDKDILISRPFADNYGLELGTDITLYGKRLRIIGLYDAGDLLESNSIVMDIATLRAFKSQDNIVSFVGVQIAPNAEPETVLNSIESTFPDSNIQPFISSAIGNESKMFKKINDFGSFVTILAYVLIIITTMNTLSRYIVDHRQEYTVFRIMGWGKKQLTLIVALESLLYSIASLLLGMLLAYGVLVGITHFNIIDFISMNDLNIWFLGQAALFVLASSALGITPPLYRLFKNDPGSVFKNV